jgi:hypothetical protein
VQREDARGQGRIVTLEYRISKTTTRPGWAEIHIVTRRPLEDSPDFDLMGEAARMKIAKTIVSMVSGIAHVFGDEKFEKLCVKFARKHGLIL